MILHVYIQHNSSVKKQLSKPFEIFGWYFLIATVFINAFKICKEK